LEKEILIEFDNVTKIFDGKIKAVSNLSMEIAEGETVVLLGTSGSGKTTTMKMVNRLIDSTSGRILINGKDIIEQDTIELRLMIGYAVQNIGLFPHMNVAENIAVVPRLLKWTEKRISKRIDELIEMVGLESEEFRYRFPAQLSGGQKQRIGVARALAADPPILLMDEPFGALDPITRDQLQNEFIDLLSKIKKTIIFVTHDVFEAIKMGDRIAILNEGYLQQIGEPAEIIDKPANEFVAQFLGQQRFQLSLLTVSVKQIMEKPRNYKATGEKDKIPAHLKGKSSIIEAIDMFRKTNTEELPVFERDSCIGVIKRVKLIEIVSEMLARGKEDI
jgi:osmoprotectant transport system ATP-binding protein